MSHPAGRGDDVEFVLSRVRAGGSVVVSGSMGVGKTALLRHTANVLRSEGVVVTEIAANAAATNIPFGALSGFIDPSERLEPAVHVAAATERLQRLATDSSSVLFLDDAQHLDLQTIAVIHQVVAAGDTVVMASIRDSDPAPPALRDLWRRAEVERLELGPLDDEATASIVSAALGTDAADRNVSDIVRRSAGNPLFAGELIRAHLAGAPTGLTPQLVDLVEQRIGALSPAEQEQLTIIAVGQPLDVTVDIIDIATVMRLEALGLVTTLQVDDTVVARPAHPLHSEVIRSELSPIRRRSLSIRLSDSLMHQSKRRRGDALRVVSWLLDAGDRPPPDLAEAAAFEALGWLDTELADRLASIAVADDRTASTLFVLGEVRRLRGRRDEAATLWEEAFAIASADDDIRRIALALGQLYQLFLRRREEALRVLHAALDRIEDPAMRFGIQSDLVMTESTGDRRAAVADIEALLDDPQCGDESAWTALSDLIWMKATALDLDGVDRHLARAADVEQRLPPDRDGELDLMHALYTSIEYSRNRFDASLASAKAFRADSANRGIASGVTMFIASQVHQIIGDIDGAEHAADDAIQQVEAFDTFNVAPMLLWHRSILAAQRGDHDLAVELSERADLRAGGDAPWQVIWMPRAMAWISRAKGDVGDALRLAQDSGKNAFDTGEIGWGCLSFHDAITWGGASEVVDTLDRQRSHVTDVAFWDIVLDHAVAASEESLGALAHVARRFEASGARWFAASAWANRAVCSTDPIEACRDATRASRGGRPCTEPTPTRGGPRRNDCGHQGDRRPAVPVAAYRGQPSA